MKFQSSQAIPFPVDTVFRLVRDRLQELVPFLPNVKTIETESREELENGRILLVNRWYGKGEIPVIVQKLVKPEALTWLDTATWDEEARTCSWNIKTMFLQDNINCAGVNYYRQEGRGKTRMEITGDLTISTKGVPGVPRLLEKKVSGQVEKVVVSLLTPNLESLAQGVIGYLRENQE